MAYLHTKSTYFHFKVVILVHRWVYKYLANKCSWYASVETIHWRKYTCKL